MASNRNGKKSSGEIVAAINQSARLAKRLFIAKQARRRALASLSFPEKISILLQLQKIAAEVRSAAGRAGPSPWKLTRGNRP
jgi:hypothetical protein